MSRIVFLANVKDAADATKTYGPGYELVLFDEPQIDKWRSEGKVALMGVAVWNVRVASVATTTAQLAWTVSDSRVNNMRVDYGTTVSYGSSQAATPPSTPGNIVCNLTGLTTATLYYYRIVVPSNPGGDTIVQGNFTTL